MFSSGYLNENGHLNLRNFEKYMEKLSEVKQCFIAQFLNEYMINRKIFDFLHLWDLNVEYLNIL